MGPRPNVPFVLQTPHKHSLPLFPILVGAVSLILPQLSVHASMLLHLQQVLPIIWQAAMQQESLQSEGSLCTSCSSPVQCNAYLSGSSRSMSASGRGTSGLGDTSGVGDTSGLLRFAGRFPLTTHQSGGMAVACPSFSKIQAIRNSALRRPLPSPLVWVLLRLLGLLVSNTLQYASREGGREPSASSESCLRSSCSALRMPSGVAPTGGV